MGCWGITALESDAGLDALDMIRAQIDVNGSLKLEEVLERMKKNEWNAPPDVRRCNPHTSPMMLAEVMVKCIDGNAEDLDFKEMYPKEKRFSSLSAFSVSKEEIRWLRDYLKDSLKFSCERAETVERCGWFKKKDWIGWQEHMKDLITRMDILLASDLESGELTELHTSGVENVQDHSYGKILHTMF